MPQLDAAGFMLSDSTVQSHRIGRLRSPSSAASRSTSTKFAKAHSVKRRARMKPTDSRGRACRGSARMLGSLPTLMQCVANMMLVRSEEHTSELQSLMRISYADFCLKKNKQPNPHSLHTRPTTYSSYYIT